MTEPTYTVRRFTLNDEHPDNHRVIATGLTRAEAQAHCNDPATHGEDPERGKWFDGYEADR
jgi:hypothetical protein